MATIIASHQSDCTPGQSGFPYKWIFMHVLHTVSQIKSCAHIYIIESLQYQLIHLYLSNTVLSQDRCTFGNIICTLKHNEAEWRMYAWISYAIIASNCSLTIVRRHVISWIGDGLWLKLRSKRMMKVSVNQRHIFERFGLWIGKLFVKWVLYILFWGAYWNGMAWYMKILYAGYWLHPTLSWKAKYCPFKG